NINSVRLRLPLVAQLIQHTPLDILCLQETKVQDSQFPLEGLQALGFPHIAFRGEKGYNGVAILSKLPLTHIHSEAFAGRPDRRHIAATLPDGTELHNLYIPAGGDIPDPDTNPSFDFKLRFVDALGEWFGGRYRADHPLVVVGDFNIAPLEHDVWSHRQLLNVVSHTPVEVEKLERFRDTLGFIDAIRSFVPESEKIYSWWSYRARDWAASDRGRKLDHIWLTPVLKPRLKQAEILKEVRGWTQPSDHAPVVAELAA
ncbi:MAG: exodeoxyribonuclease III, partial [Planctomycetaceae bacterium]|nr:exodeoxyribonuclease III [Planctomycetaceae bacterium]